MSIIRLIAYLIAFFVLGLVLPSFAAWVLG